MPRLPVDGKKVIEHRITFGTKERELLDSYVFGNQFNQISDPIIKLISDVSAMTFLTSLYLAFRYGDDVAAQLGDQFDNVTDLFGKANLIIKENKPLVSATSDLIQSIPIPFLNIDIDTIQRLFGGN